MTDEKKFSKVGSTDSAQLCTTRGVIIQCLQGLLGGGTIIILASSVMWILGWIYWSAYSNYFGLNINFIALDLTRVIEATIGVPLLVLFFLAKKLFQDRDIAARFEAKMNIARMMRDSLIFLAGFPLILADLPISHKIIGGLVLALVAGLITYYDCKVKLSNTLWKSWHIRLNAILGICFLIGVLYWQAGVQKAIALAQGKDSRRITVMLQDEARSITNAVLVAHAANKYIVAIPGTNPHPKVYAIDDSKVRYAIMWNAR